jgi:hypothetical protein
MPFDFLPTWFNHFSGNKGKAASTSSQQSASLPVKENKKVLELSYIGFQFPFALTNLC